MIRSVCVACTLAVWAASAGAARAATLDDASDEAGRELFSDDFESGLGRWDVRDPVAIAVVDSGQPEHGKVLRLAPSGARLYALMRGSEDWKGYRVEGSLLFPTDESNYLGWIYNFRESEERVDLGSLYVKGNGSYVRVNPRRDWNPARMLYEEYRTALTGDDAIRIGEWKRFAVEVVGPVCHFYVGNLEVPKVTFDLYEGRTGQAGFKPRVVGGPVWIDDIRVVSIAGLTYLGPSRPPGIEPHPEALVTDWEALGPLTRTYESVESPGSRSSIRDGGAERRWAPFSTDRRGAVITGRLNEFLGSRTVSYFRTRIEVDDPRGARLAFSTIDDLAVWVDGVFQGYVDRERFAWYDFGVNPEHPPNRGDVPLGPGPHRILIRVRGGQYATGGFFARVLPPEASTGG